jgi:hypothetical protein
MMLEAFFHWQHIMHWEFCSEHASDDTDTCMKLTIYPHKAICLKHPKTQTETGTWTYRHSLPMMQQLVTKHSTMTFHHSTNHEICTSFNQ